MKCTGGMAPHDPRLPRSQPAVASDPVEPSGGTWRLQRQRALKECGLPEGIIGLLYEIPSGVRRARLKPDAAFFTLAGAIIGSTGRDHAVLHRGVVVPTDHPQTLTHVLGAVIRQARNGLEQAVAQS